MENDVLAACSVSETLKIFTAKWKPCIICHLDHGPKRFGELHRLIGKISRRMLTQHLQELLDDDIVYRKSYPVIPPKVEYYLTNKGQSLMPLLESIQNWGMIHLDDVKSIEELVSKSHVNLQAS